MAEDLLEDMDGEESGEDLDSQEGSAEKKSFLKRLLGGKKKLIIIFLTLVLVLSAAAGGWYFFFSTEEEEPVSQAEIELQQAMEQEIVFEDIVELAPFERIALRQGSAMRSISLAVALELTDHRYRKQVYTVQDRLSRVVTAQLRNMTWLELRSAEGKIQLKYELLSQMNRVFPRVTIRNIYFTQFLMQ